MSLTTLAAFWAVSMLLIITPGVDWAYTVSARLKNRVTPAVSGLLMGHMLGILLVAAGAGALIAQQPGVITAMTLAGAAYLLWLGIQSVWNPSKVGTISDQPPGSSAHWTWKGVAVSGLNPKAFLLYLALMPQFVNPAPSWPAPLQILTLGLIHILGCGAIYVLVGRGSQAKLRVRPAAAIAISRFSGAAMIIIAVLLIAERVGG